MYKCRLTVFTPTFNRAHTLERLYLSLKSQTFTDFEWLVIDDGSTDNTKGLVDRWLQDQNPFPIHYHLKENGGKNTAINDGLEKANGELFFTVDSDDYLTNDALEKINNWVNNLPENSKFCGVVGNMGVTPKETPNTIFKEPWRDANLLERYPEVSKLPIDGERAYVFFTEIHKKYKYPVFVNEKFMTEAVTWNRMANDGYKIRVYNDIIYIYEFQPTGLTMSGSKLFIENPKGYGLWLREKSNFSNYSLKQRLRLYYSYFSAVRPKLSVKKIAENLETPTFTILFFSVLYAIKQKINKTRDLKRSKKFNS